MQRQDVIDSAKLVGGSTWVVAHFAGLNWGTVSNVLASILALMGIASYLWKWTAAWIEKFKARED